MKLMTKAEPRLHYSIDLRIQIYTEPVPSIYGKLATKYLRGHTDIFTVYSDTILCEETMTKLVK